MISTLVFLVAQMTTVSKAWCPMWGYLQSKEAIYRVLEYTFLVDLLKTGNFVN